jgi:hypothetical protein
VGDDWRAWREAEWVAACGVQGGHAGEKPAIKHRILAIEFS